MRERATPALSSYCRTYQRPPTLAGMEMLHPISFALLLALAATGLVLLLLGIAVWWPNDHSRSH